MYNEMFTMYNAKRIFTIQPIQIQIISTLLSGDGLGSDMFISNGFMLCILWPSPIKQMQCDLGPIPYLILILFLNHHVAIISADGCSSDMFIANPGVLRRPCSRIVEDEVVGHTLYNFHSADPTGWAEPISGIGLCLSVRPSSLRR